MPINFPDSPAENDSFTSGGKKWIFNGTVWTLITANSYTIPTGEVTTDKIATGAVHEVKLASAAVAAAKLASGAAVSNIGYTPANIASPTFTGTPTLPTGTIAITQTAANSTTAVATTAFVTTADNLKANLASPTFTGTPTLPTGTIATTQTAANSTTAVATTAFVTTADNLKANLASPTFTGTVTTSDLTVNGLVNASGRGEFRTNAISGRGVGVGGGTSDTPAIIQFINNAFSAQWGNITASSAYALAINAYDGTAGSIALNASSITTSTPITGSITQTIYTPYTTGYTRINTSATPFDITGFTMSITPKKTGNKIIILVQVAAYSICDGFIHLKKNGTLVANPLIGLPRVDFVNDDAQFYAQYVDTAASTAAITYQFASAATGCGGGFYINTSAGVSSTIMIEVQS